MTLRTRFDQFAAGAALVIAGALAPQAVVADVTLKVADTFPPGHYIVETGTTYWMERVTELTDGEVKFQYFGAGQLGSLRDMFSMVQSGVVDIGYVPPAYNGGTMPLAGVHTLPGLFSKSSVGTPAFFDTVTSGPILENDFLGNGMRPVWGVMTSTYNLFTRSKDVEGLEDIAGLKLKTIAGNMAESVKALGGAPVDIPSPETYQAIRTGTVDGTIFPTTSVYSYKLDEVIDTAVLGLDVFVYWAPYVISEEVWQGLSPEHQQAIQQAAQEAMQRVAEETDRSAAELEDKMRDGGIKVIVLDEAQREQVKVATAPVFDSWVTGLKERGLPADEVLEAFRANIEKHQQQ
ncbi:MAG: TRAP transporter substrate-binding protein DctP [Sulfitobacter sp.]|jgi:TRAP-type C4-dicarboxylate transport system substrate-binding protein|tara:strand:- start:5013 stop:6056 length:1044 start_codon:yes stop_codon:yes gene_type:complete